MSSNEHADVEWFYSSAPISADKAEIIKEMACTLKFQSAQEVAKKISVSGPSNEFRVSPPMNEKQ